MDHPENDLKIWNTVSLTHSRCVQNMSIASTVDPDVSNLLARSPAAAALSRYFLGFSRHVMELSDIQTYLSRSPCRA
jgi:hypothetical protein